MTIYVRVAGNLSGTSIFDERVLDKPEVNNNNDKTAICGRKMPILKRYCNVLIRNVKL